MNRFLRRFVQVVSGEFGPPVVHLCRPDGGRVRLELREQADGTWAVAGPAGLEVPSGSHLEFSHLSASTRVELFTYRGPDGVARLSDPPPAV